MSITKSIIHLSTLRGLKTAIMTAAVLSIFVSPAALAAGGNGSEIVGTVPYLLTATGDTNSQNGGCPLGNAVADATRTYLDCDIAIICGGDLVDNLPSGEITWDELRSVFAEDRPLATATITVKQLREILEAGLSHIVLDDKERIDAQASMYEGGYPQISGLTLNYDASAAPGERVRFIAIGDENMKLDDDTTQIKLAATIFMLEGGYGMPAKADTMVPSGKTLVDVMARYISDGMADYRNTGERIHPMGVSNVPLSGVLIAGVIIVITALSWSRSRRMMKRYSNFKR